MKSPPYNPASNGQAERLVRTVKEVLKKFLLEPEVAVLDLEDQINLFLFNFRNNNMTRDGHFPSERIFSYRPKTVLDLINPKKHYKQHLEVPQTNDEIKTNTSAGKIPRHSNDAIDNLISGDSVWYKNHSPYDHARWVNATFIKKYSPNTFQIRIGNVETMAHRNQIRIHKEASSWQRPNILIRRHEPDETTKDTLVDLREGEQVYEGEKDELPTGSARKNRKRKRDISQPEFQEPRRSKRNKKINQSDDFCYN